jgi:hypothetical protein
MGPRTPGAPGGGGMMLAWRECHPNPFIKKSGIARVSSAALIGPLVERKIAPATDKVAAAQVPLRFIPVLTLWSLRWLEPGKS